MTQTTSFFPLYVTRRRVGSDNLTVSNYNRFQELLKHIRDRSVDELRVFSYETGDLLEAIPNRHFGAIFANEELSFNAINVARARARIAAEYAAADKPVTPNVSEFMTQNDIAEFYKIYACRVRTLFDLGWLKHDHKLSRNFMYRRSDVLNLQNNPAFVTWLNNQHEKRRANASA